MIDILLAIVAAVACFAAALAILANNHTKEVGKLAQANHDQLLALAKLFAENLTTQAQFARKRGPAAKKEEATP